MVSGNNRTKQASEIAEARALSFIHFSPCYDAIKALEYCDKFTQRVLVKPIVVTMSSDPYHAVQHEIQTSLQTAAQLRASYVRIRSTARDDSEELEWARNEVCSASKN